MRSKLLFLALIVLLAFALPVSAELSHKEKAFESGTTLAENGWASWGSGSGSGPSGYSWRALWAYLDDGTGAYGPGSDGKQFLALPLSDDGWYENWNWDYNTVWPSAEEDFYTISEGRSFTIGAYFKDLDGGEPTTAYMYFEWLDINGEGCCFNDNNQSTLVGERTGAGWELDPLADWTYYEATAIAPWGTVTVRPTVGHSGNINEERGKTWYSGGTIGVDQVWLDFFSQFGAVYDPQPANGKQGVDPATTQLKWTRAKSCPQTFKCELYWGVETDPNFWNSCTKEMDLADVNSFDLADALSGPITLQPEQVYYWAVKFDPNACDDDEINLRKGPVWTFDTINRPPVVDAGLHYERWQDDPCTPSPIKIAFDASYTDDGLPAGGNLTYAWTETHTGATDPCFPDGTDVEDPNVIFKSPGDYILTLTIHDNDGGPQDQVGEGEILIRIFANSDDRLRAHYPLDSDPCDTVGGHDGSLVDDPVFDPNGGQVAGAVELDGTDDLLDDDLPDFVQIDDTGSDPNFQPDTWENSDLIDGMTVSAWMKLDADGWSTTWESIVSKSNNSWELNRDAGNDNVRFVVQGGIGEAVSSGTDVESGWHQVVGVYDRNNVKIYVDGLEADPTPNDAGTINLDNNPQNTKDWQIQKAPGKVRIGAAGHDAGMAFAGLIDQVRIFDAAVPHRSEHAGTPGIVEMYRADGGHDNCGGVYIVGDTNEDCYITLADFALVAKDWLDCNDVSEENCPLSHHTQ